MASEGAARVGGTAVASERAKTVGAEGAEGARAMAAVEAAARDLEAAAKKAPAVVARGRVKKAEERARAKAAAKMVGNGATARVVAAGQDSEVVATMADGLAAVMGEVEEGALEVAAAVEMGTKVEEAVSSEAAETKARAVARARAGAVTAEITAVDETVVKSGEEMEVVASAEVVRVEVAMAQAVMERAEAAVAGTARVKEVGASREAAVQVASA